MTLVMGSGRGQAQLWTLASRWNWVNNLSNQVWTVTRKDTSGNVILELPWWIPSPPMEKSEKQTTMKPLGQALFPPNQSYSFLKYVSEIHTDWRIYTRYVWRNSIDQSCVRFWSALRRQIKKDKDLEWVYPVEFFLKFSLGLELEAVTFAVMS